ncbi:hypothetical protein AB0L74_20025 [Streptomyces sp. NPDC052020]|uniref:hypothetical protein n=1 Tax=Streptomyces sp. NPDC052020 TaxID=3155677 RepID=UPI0034142404
MRERPEAAAVTELQGEEGRDVRGQADKKRIDLSVPQVAGSALAAVVAAKLASSFGVYGTIVGAGVVSAIATCGGTLFQHFFKRTGEQLRSTGVTARHQERSRRHTPPAPGEFTEGTVYRARVRGWKRPVIAAALVFGVTMAGITVYEVASGHNLSGGSSTTVGDALSGRDKSAAGSGDADNPGERGDSGGSGDARNSPEPEGSNTPGTGRTPTDGPSKTADGGTGAGASPGASPSRSGAGEDGATPEPSPSGSQDSGDARSPVPSGPATAPEPSASSRSGTGDPGPGGSAAS